MMMTRGMGSKRIDIQFHGHIKHEKNNKMMVKRVQNNFL